MERTLPDGYRLRFDHERPLMTLADRRTGGTREEPATRGGTTVARILDAADNEVARAEAVCRPDENYSKKIGRQVAGGRALKALHASLS